MYVLRVFDAVVVLLEERDVFRELVPRVLGLGDVAAEPPGSTAVDVIPLSVLVAEFEASFSDYRIDEI